MQRAFLFFIRNDGMVVETCVTQVERDYAPPTRTVAVYPLGGHGPRAREDDGPASAAAGRPAAGYVDPGSADGRPAKCAHSHFSLFCGGLTV